MQSKDVKSIKKDELDSLKWELVSRKVRKCLTKIDDCYLIDDEEISYLTDCLNLRFNSNFNFKDIMLVISLKRVPKDLKLEENDVVSVTINGISNQSSDIVVLDPLGNQIANVNKIDAGNTKLKNRLTLSYKAILLVNEDYKLDDEILQNYLVIRYKGDIKQALFKILIYYSFKPQEIINAKFRNQENNEILLNYLKQNYPNKILIITKESLLDRQTKELSIRDEVLSIIRNSPILILDDIDIVPKELVFLAEHYKNIHGLNDIDLDKVEFADFVNIYGVRMNKFGVYLLDDDALFESGYADSKMIDDLYEVYLRTKKNYKERLNAINNRKKILNSINVDSIKNERAISLEELESLYKAYQENTSNDNSAKKFMQVVGVRINKNYKLTLLTDDETIDMSEFIDITDEERMSACLRENFGIKCYTESDREFGSRLKNMNSINLSFDGLEELFVK